jgi:CRP/FNR family transcriptional regulator, cyclic AMP receptor protein
VPESLPPTGMSFPGDDAPDLTADDSQDWRLPKPTGATRRALLPDDPELADSVPEVEREHAIRAIWVDTFRLEAGPVDLSQVDLSAGAVALLLTDGAMTMDIVVGARTLTELLLPGDVLPVEPAPVTTPESERGVRVLADARLAILDQRFMRAALRWPGLTRTIIGRLNEQKHRVATHGAICQLPRVEQRIMAILCYQASRTGRVTSEGTLFPGPASHREIARLIGAQRSTVSLAIAALEAQGLLRRRDASTWLLPRYHGQRVRVEDLIPDASDPRADTLATGPAA